MTREYLIPAGLYYVLSGIGILEWIATGLLLALGTGSLALIIGVIKDERLYPMPKHHRHWYRGQLTREWYETK